MQPPYDNSQHLHIGYYENNYDIEAIGYKRVDEDIWDVYFNFESYGINHISLEKEINMDEYASYYAFSIYKRNPT